MMTNTHTGILNNDIDEIFLRAYARQGMSYSPLENDYYERPQSE